MLNQSIEKTEIAVRLYDNNSYGTTYGKGLYRRAIYNGTIDAKEFNAKYLVDFYSYEDWVNMAKTDSQMEIVRGIETESDTLYSWIKYYDQSTRDKVLVTGMSRINIDTMKILVLICDTDHGVVKTWSLSAKQCKQSIAGLKSPQILATNGDLDSW
jgi:uncharacterized protein YbaA (DUF1428 family)